MTDEIIDPELREKSLRYSPKLTQAQREEMVTAYNTGQFSMKDLSLKYKVAIASVRDSLIRYGCYNPKRREPYNFNKNYGTKLNKESKEKKEMATIESGAISQDLPKEEVIDLPIDKKKVKENIAKFKADEAKKTGLDNETDLKKEDFLPNNDEVEKPEPFLCGRCYKSGIETEIKKGQESCHKCGAVLEWL